MVKVHAPDEPGHLDDPVHARLWCAIRDNNPAETAAALAQGAPATGCARRGEPFTVFALDRGAHRALAVLLAGGADVWDEHEGKPLWAHTFSLQVPARIHGVVFADSRLRASSTHASLPGVTPASILLWKRNNSFGMPGEEEAFLDAAEQSLTKRPGDWSEATWVNAFGQAVRSRSESPQSLPRLDALGCGLAGASNTVKARVVNDAAYLAQWEAPESERVAGRATEWLLYFAATADPVLRAPALAALDRMLDTVPVRKDPAVAQRVAVVEARCLARELPAAVEAEGRRRL